MNTGAKVLVGVGSFIIIIGILVMAWGFSSAGGVEKWNPTDDIFWEGESGTGSFVHFEEGVGTDLFVFVTDDVRCDDFTLEIEGGNTRWEQDQCVEDGKLPSGHGDDPEGWLHIGTIKGLEDGVEYTITTSHDVVLVGWEVIEELIGSLVGGLVGICGGPSFLCCGLIFLVVGAILAFTQKDNQKRETKIVVGNDGRIAVQGNTFSYDTQE